MSNDRRGAESGVYEGGSDGDGVGRFKGCSTVETSPSLATSLFLRPGLFLYAGELFVSMT